jgi:predicted dehydrogenase
MTPGVAATGRQPLRLGIVGCGFVTEDRHLPALARVPEVVVAALADRDDTRAAHVGSRFGIAALYPSAEALLAEADVDAVAVCTPAASHREPALAALDAGKHVFVEKPLALSVADADVLAEREARHAGVTMVGFNLRRHRLVGRARALLAGGRIGRVTGVASTWTDARLLHGPVPAWRSRRADGGGSAFEKLVHHIDLWRFLLGEEVQEVFALARDERSEDEVTVVTARLASGALAQALTSDVTGTANELVIFGDEGALRLDLYRFDGLEVSGLSDLPGSPRTRLRMLGSSAAHLVRGAEDVRRGGLFDASYAAQWRDFAAAARGERPAGSSFADGRAALRVVLAATESSSSGRPVRLGGSASTPAPSDGVPLAETAR